MNQQAKGFESLESVVIRFVGDSGDGMQLTGNKLTGTSALFGNDIATLPDFPAEIRAPTGTIAGLSGFQIQIGHKKINTPGERPDLLVAMNPAALKANVADLNPGGLVIVDQDSFSELGLKKAGYASNPLEDGSLTQRHLIAPITAQTVKALEGLNIPRKNKEKCKNFFTLGVVFWLYERSPEHTIEWLRRKFSKKPDIAEANIKALKEGMNYANNCGYFQSRYKIDPAKLPPGKYRSLTGNQALSLGLVAAGERLKLKILMGGYPITPASEVLHDMAVHKNFGIKTFQAEDEIAGVCAALGASYAGGLGVTVSSGPGIALKMETIGLAVATELPLVVIDVQRGGPSTGLPTKTEQADLLQVMYGRNSESPVPVIAAKSPADCFYQAIEAARIAVKYMTPVFLLSDGYLGNGSEPFKIPEVEDLPDISRARRTDPEGFQVYKRDPATLAREWVKPGTKGLAHRIGGLEKDFLTGDVSYDSLNHEKMTRMRQQRVDNMASDIRPLEVFGDAKGDVLIVGWGSTYGPIRTLVNGFRNEGRSVSQAHFTHLNPFPENTRQVLESFKHIVIAEKNLGQLNKLIRAAFCLETHSITKVQGRPFFEADIAPVIERLLQ